MADRSESGADTDELAAYLDEAVARALGEPPLAVGERTAVDPARPSRRAVIGRAATRFANSRAGHGLRVATGSSEHLRVLRTDVDAMSRAHHDTYLLAAQALARVEGLRNEVSARLGTLQAAIAGLELAVEELDAEIERMRAGSNLEEVIAEDDDVDEFYAEFEMRFRGAPDEIKRRLEVYLPLLFGRPHRGSPVVDIGSGRGEWLQLLKEHGVDGTGVELNAKFATQSVEDGLDIVQADAFEYLASLPENSVGAVTAFQFVEHFPPARIVQLLRLAYRALWPGGCVLLETPNPSNLRVAAFSFYLDPTHVRPVHPEFLRFATERCGFVQVGVEFANVAADAADAADAGQELPLTTPQLRELVGHVDWALFGPQDYAVFGIKPDPEG